MQNMYELKKDISTPNGYRRAGERNTKEFWEALFPDCFHFSSNEWFINLSEAIEVSPCSAETIFVSKVFDKMELRSMSYKEAAAKCITQFIRVGNIPNALSLLQREVERIEKLSYERDEKVAIKNHDRKNYCRIAIGLIEELSVMAEGIKILDREQNSSL